MGRFYIKIWTFSLKKMTVCPNQTHIPRGDVGWHCWGVSRRRRAAPSLPLLRISFSLFVICLLLDGSEFQAAALRGFQPTPLVPLKGPFSSSLIERERDPDVAWLPQSGDYELFLWEHSPVPPVQHKGFFDVCALLRNVCKICLLSLIWLLEILIHQEKKSMFTLRCHITLYSGLLGSPLKSSDKCCACVCIFLGKGLMTLFRLSKGSMIQKVLFLA